jgi:hypothetical protein
VIYAVLLALVVIAVWEQYGAARETVEQEANAAADIFWLANQLPEPRGTHLQELVRSYAQEGLPLGGPSSTTSCRTYRGSSHARRAKNSSRRKGSSRTIPWLMQGGCVWWRRRKVFPVCFGQC